MPVEILAGRGLDTLRFGPMKPVGLRDPRTGHRPWAVLQLRTENSQKTLFNLVGFQTNLRFPEQKKVFGMIPALKNAEYVRYGVMHRMESAGSGLLAGINAARRFNGESSLILPRETMLGALANYISCSESKDFQPMGANLGILPPLEEHIRDKRERAAAYAQRALKLLGQYI